MADGGAVAFTLKRSSDLWDAEGGYESKTETAHGLLRLESDRLVIQWRLAVETEVYGATYETREEIEPVREIVILLDSVAGAFVPPPRWWHFGRPKLVITASDLLAFEEVAGQQGLRLKHPAKLVLRIQRADRLAAEEFAAELALALARLPDGDAEGRSIPASTLERDSGPPVRLRPAMEPE
ncbi:MAG: hypothetical protein OXE96_12900 [Gemmatimonadetes bacterium]|nr:hypothetical protein [Gemmatimonadota bacterium]